ncbi:FitA-like ribbon-helix-helix domain-containing protein [Methylophilus medardicus]|uniref:Plasmid stability protein n=1 Tax=Methylophilus medardicus TaxID=2588534 RepID=A0A5B8CT12_9PROT|nr:plasmid stability protein [Methylophilus medardicus]QDC49434.1 plasmid stability protein [Methylophilus medardicus]QDC53139.1 plasmid stability protein [Methylophilus medardicus]
MSVVTVRNLSEETRRVHKSRAARKHRRPEAEIRFLENAVRPGHRVMLGTLLTAIGREAEGVEIKIERDQTASVPMGFEWFY